MALSIWSQRATPSRRDRSTRLMSNHLRSKKFMQRWLNASLPAWIIFLPIFAALCLSHFTLLALPYYWDEAGYYIPAAWDFFRTGSLIPITTLSNAHPPLPSIYLALWWKVFSFCPVVTRVAVLVVASLGLTAVWRLAMRVVGVPAVAFWTVALTAVYPVWFAQSSLAHADIFAAACTLWGLVYALPGRNGELTSKPWAAALWFAAGRAVKRNRHRHPAHSGCHQPAGKLSRLRKLPLASAASGRLAHQLRVAAGRLVRLPPLQNRLPFWQSRVPALQRPGQPLEPLRILSAFGYRILHLTAHMNLFVPVLMAVAALLLEPRLVRKGSRADKRPAIEPAVLRRILLLLLVNAVLFSVLGGALLTRYLLPMFPLVLLIAVSTLYRRVPYWQGIAVFSAVTFRPGMVHQSALPLCPGRQSGLRPRHSPPSGWHPAARRALPRRKGAFRLARQR